jgi:4,5-dihydroxyphthalate decarboxylase
MPGDLELKFSVADYHRTRPLLTGAVTLPGIKPSFYAALPGEACLRPVYEEFDVAEMSLSWYVMAKERGEPVYALPIFPLRMFIHPYISYRTGSGIAAPKDLIGKRIGMDRYRLTVGLWARGILRDDYGVVPEAVQWVTGEPEGAGFEIPSSLKLTMAGKDAEQMLLDGDIDALISPNVPEAFRAGDARIQRLFPQTRDAVQAYFDRTKMFPITHMVVVREDLLMKEPWLADRLLAAFEEADRLARKEYEYPKRLSFPTGQLFLEEEEKRFGKNPWQHGLEPNRHTLETFMRYAHEQGYTKRRLGVDEAFWTADKATAGTTRSGLIAAE